MKMVLVEWEDPCTYATHGWLPKEDTDDETMLPISCVSVGILYKENKERIVLYMNGNKHDFCNAQCIPRSCIKRIRTLKVVK